MGQTSTNLGLYLPTKDDYLVVSRDIAGNFQTIDNAFTPVEITDQIVFSAGITVTAGGVFKFGKLIIVQLRIENNGNSETRNIADSGFPPCKNGNGTFNCVAITCGNTGYSGFIRVAGSAAFGSAGSALPSNSSIAISACYICE